MAILDSDDQRDEPLARMTTKEDEMNMMLKGCRRCGGDLIPDGGDREGRTMTCLQCGHESYLRVVSPVFRMPAPRPARPLAA
jgi:NADH pyrophosphatase NudC (nudix superfamily)